MGYIARLRKNALIFDLDGSNGVGLMDDFEPPSAQLANNITSGPGANFYGGGEFISRKASPISFSFSVRSLGASNAQAEQQIDRLANFLAVAGDKRDPVWLEFRPDNNVGFEPLWGQTGAFRRVEVLALEGLAKSSYASLYNARNRAVLASVTVTVNLPALGNRQRTGSALYGVLEDWMGAKDGKSRGVIIPEATTNKMVNPIFGYSTWYNNWSVGGGVLLGLNTDPEFVLFGNCSAKLTSTTGDYFVANIAAGNTNKHSAEFYCKRPDSAAITAADCLVQYHGVNQTTTYTSIGNGWYKVSAVNFDGVIASQGIGLGVLPGAIVYLSGAMFVEAVYNIPMTYGDLPGCAWSSTAHNSTSIRTGGYYMLPVDNTTFSFGQWTIRLVWKADRTITGIEKFFLCDVTPKLSFSFTAADKWSLTDGTNTALSAALSITVGTTYTFHLVASLAGLVVYLNGVSIATAATYTAPVLPTDIFIGTNSAALKAPNGTFKGFTTYARAMTQTEVTADYNNILPLITADKRIDWMPYRTINFVYNYHDPSNYVYDDNTLIGSIPGDMPSEMQIKITPTGFTFNKSIWIGNHLDDYNHWINPLYRFYLEGAGTATAATDSSSNVLTIALPTGTPRTGITRAVNFPDRIHGTFHFFVRMRSSAGTKSIGVGYYLLYNGGYLYTTDKTVSVDTTSRWYYLGKLNLEPSKLFDQKTITTLGELTLTVGVNFYSTAGADNLLVDFAEVVNGDLCVIKQYASDAPGGGGAASYPAYVRMMGHNAFFDVNNRIAAVIGDSIELSPEVNNTLTMHFADDAGAHVIADHAFITFLDITPRWMTA